MLVMALSMMDDILPELGGAHVFSTMDLVSGILQCRIHGDSIPLMAVCTQSGYYGVDGHADESRVECGVVPVDHAPCMRGPGVSASLY